jgi:TPR repeat protein
MALGYRYWTGIGVVEDCERAVEWYSAAAEQGKPGVASHYPVLIFEQPWHDTCLDHLVDARFR